MLILVVDLSGIDFLWCLLIVLLLIFAFQFLVMCRLICGGLVVVAVVVLVVPHVPYSGTASISLYISSSLPFRESSSNGFPSISMLGPRTMLAYMSSFPYLVQMFLLASNLLPRALVHLSL
ncbi:uncharacterized protein LOC107642926 isoform X1 [Arachis ipaensis]|uniref:uncharacterized protein LOC107642926 isoform X1 n=1 Tax=Arachis ipaensis TaxID=130454 RepID=UPI0007AF22EE|nr:uncharacterized protein LOC107642926 isoform X1 [Arachis ipaensis]XP_029148978.1 uncharacterized protein LOC112749496 isoform X1 [Arachis hypogaea]